jgi:hypothetical protein
MQNGFSPAWTLKSVKTEYPNDGFGLPSKTDYIYLGMTNDTGGRRKDMYVYAERGPKCPEEG